MADTYYHNPHNPTLNEKVGNATQSVLDGTHPIIQNTKNDFNGFGDNVKRNKDADQLDPQPLSHFHKTFYDLLTWKFPISTGVIFGSTVSIILAFHYLSVLRYVFKAAYISFLGAAALELAGKPFGQGVISSVRPKVYYTIPRGALETIFDGLHDFTNFAVLEVQRILFVENIYATVAAFFVSFLGYFLIKYIPVWVLLILGTSTAFLTPLVYLNNQELIDAQISRISGLLNEKIHVTKDLTEKYAKDALNVAQATTADLSQKVQGYTARKPTSPTVKSEGKVDLSDAPAPPTAIYPDVPRTELPDKNDPATDPLLA